MKMSLETLLEAAKYLEYRSEANARGEDPQDFQSFMHVGNNNNRHKNKNGHCNGSYSLATSPSEHLSIEDILNNAETKDRRRPGGGGTREVHNKLEKNRRAHLKKCFETLKRQIPNMDEKKTSNLGILRSALRYIQTLKRKARDYEHKTESLAREKIALQQRLIVLKMDLSSSQVDIKCLIQDNAVDSDTNSTSTSTATECGPLSDEDDDDDDFLSIDSSAVLENDREDYGPSSHSATKVQRPSELFRLLCNPPLSGGSLSVKSKTEGAYVLYCTQEAKAVSAEMGTARSTTATTVMGPPRPFPPQAVVQITQAGGVVVGGGGAMAPGPSKTPSPLPSTTSLTFGTIPSRMQVAPVSFAAQVGPQGNIQFSGSTGVLSSSKAMQFLAQPTVRLISAGQMAVTSANGSSRGVNASSTTAGPSSSSTSYAAVQMRPPASSLVTTIAPVQVGTLTSAPTGSMSGPSIKGLLTSANGQGQITFAQLAVKPPNSSLPTLTLSPSLTAAALNFHSAQNTAASSSTIGNPSNNLTRHIVTAPLKPITQVRPSQVTQIAHVMAPTTLVSSLRPGARVTPVSVIPSLGHATVAQVLGPAATQLGKIVTSSPFNLKSIGQIPIIQQQFVPQLSAVPSTTSRPLVKPIVVVTAPSMVTTTTTASIAPPVAAAAAASGTNSKASSQPGMIQ